ncbi:heparinase II/III family protein [Kribbella sp. NPDC005582]|uniref:alginate lyase family protein n=1 Tax=Kribbella sp. NPDC005582 TaxID=3156893 RepID=UPI0033B42D15
MRAYLLSAALIAAVLQPVSASAAPPARIEGLAAISQATGSVASGNFIVNPGFEAAATPSGWTASARATVDSIAQQGERALKVTSTTGTGWEGANSASFGLDGRRTARVTLSAQVKLDGVVQGATPDNAAKLYIAFVNAAGVKAWQGVRLQGTQDWTEQTATYAVPAGTVSAFVSVALDRAVGTVRFDDVRVAASAPVNLVTNSGFDTTTTDPNCPAAGWCTPYLSQVYDLSDGAMRLKGVAGKKVGGFVTTQVDQAVWPVVTVAADVKTDQLVSSDFTDVPGGLRVSLSFSYVENGQTVYTGSSIIAGVITGSRGWSRISGTMRLPAKTKRIQVIPTVTNATGTAWIDNVSVSTESSWISPDTVTKSVAAGSEVVHYTTITNRRDTTETFRLSLDQSAAAPYSARLEADSITLAPGAAAQVKVFVATPEGLPAGTTREVKLVATPAGAPELTQLAWLQTAVATAAGRGEKPQVFNTASEIDALRQKVKDQGWANDAFTKVVKTEADNWLPRPLDKTMFHNAWTGNYKCPGTNTSLRFDYDKPTEHTCPIDGKVYTGEPYDSAWIETWHYNAAQGAADLGLAYQLTADPRYAAKARDLLRYYADQFVSVPLNALYGRVHYQVLDEAVSSIALVDAYDLIHESLTPAERVEIEQNLLRPMADLMMSWPTSTSNFQAWNDAGIYAIGAAIGDAAYREYALRDSEDGLEFLLNKARMDDGWWWEGSASYHVYALQALTSLAIAARGEHDYLGDPRFKQMYTALLPYLYPDLTVPAAGDGGNWGRRFGVSFTQFAEFAYGRYGDPRFAAALDYAYTNAKVPRTDRWALRYGADSIPASSGLRVGSTNFASLGEAVLQSHNGRNLAPNPGLEDESTAANGVPAYWMLEGASWVTDVVMDGKRAAKVAGDLAGWHGLRQDVPLDGRKTPTIRLSAMAKTSAATAGRVTVTFLDGRGTALATKSVALRRDADWTAYDVDATVPMATRSVRLSLGSERGTGTLWFDQVDLWTNQLLVDGRREVPVRGGNVGSLTLSGAGPVQLTFLDKDGAVLGTKAGKFRVQAEVPTQTVKVRTSAVRAVLSFEHGIDAFQANYLRLDYGIAGGTHGHADKLHLDVVGASELQSTDLGQVYGASNADLTENWYRETVSHNTVVVDGTSQDRNLRGSLKYFGSTPRLQVADAEVKGAYASVPALSDVELERAVLLTDDYALDVFDAKGTKPHRFDQSWHGAGALTIGTVPMTEAPCCVLDPNNTNFGYHLLKNVAQGTAADGRWTGTWSSGLKLTALEPEPTTVLHETGPGTASTGTAIPFVLARREGVTATRYTTLLETSPKVSSVQRVADGHVRIDLAAGRDDLLYDEGFALVKRTTSVQSIDLLQRAKVAVDGRTYVEAARRLDNASIEYAGDTLRIDVRRSAAAPTPVDVRIYAPGVRSVTLNNQPVPAVPVGGGYLKVVVNA